MDYSSRSSFICSFIVQKPTRERERWHFSGKHKEISILGLTRIHFCLLEKEKHRRLNSSHGVQFSVKYDNATCTEIYCAINFSLMTIEGVSNETTQGRNKFNSWLQVGETADSTAICIEMLVKWLKHSLLREKHLEIGSTGSSRCSWRKCQKHSLREILSSFETLFIRTWKWTFVNWVKIMKWQKK